MAGDQAASIGCFICGRAFADARTIRATCGDCGATVGMCKLCSFSVPAPRKFLAESIEWHQQHGRCTGRIAVQVDEILAAMTRAPGEPERRAASTRRRVAAGLAARLNRGAGF